MQLDEATFNYATLIPVRYTDCAQRQLQLQLQLYNYIAFGYYTVH